MNKEGIQILVSYALFIAIILSPLSPFVSYKNAEAAFNKQINYQGKLTDSSNVSVANGTYNMEFKLYTASSGGSAIWTETRTGADKVTVSSGLFSVLLGEVNSLAGVDFNQTLYLGVNIGGTGTPGWDGEMTPRKKLGAVPAAVMAETVTGAAQTAITSLGTLTGLTVTGSTTLRGLTVDNATATQDRIAISPAAVGTNRFDGTITNADLTATRTWTLPDNSGTFALTSDIPVVTGFVPYTGATSNVDLGVHNLTVDTNSLFVDSVNHRVGVGTISPGASLDVVQATQGNIALRAGILNSPNLIVGTTTGYTNLTIANGDYNHIFNTRTNVGASAERFRIGGGSAIDNVSVSNSNFVVNTNQLYVQQSTGNVGIGTTSPNYQMEVLSTGTVAGRGFGNTQISSNAAAALFNFNKARGSVGSLVTVSNNDYIGAPQFNPYDGSNYLATAGFGARVNGTVAVGSVPTDMYFWTSGGTTDTDPYSNNHIRMVISSIGNVGIGTITPGALLDVNGDVRAFTNYKSSSNNIILSDTSGTVFRGVRANAWADSLSTRFFQVGTSGDNIAFTTQNGVGANRVMISSASTQITNGGYITTNAPTGIFEVSNGTTGLLNVLSTGNVGIGTTTPSTFKLEVAGNVGPEADNTRDLGSSGRRWANVYATNFVGAITPSGFTQGSVVFAGVGGALAQDNANFFFDNTNERLGIGTNAPGYALDITTTGTNYLNINGNGVAASNGFFKITNATSTAGIMSPIFWAKGSSATYPGVWFLGDTTTDTGTKAIVNFEARQNNTTVATRPLFDFNNNGSSVMTILANGNVGIGTTTPTHLFEVGANKASIDSNGQMILNSNLYAIGNIYTQGGFSGHSADNVIPFIKRSDATEWARFDTNGNFGLGLTAPASNFQVTQKTTGVGTVSVSGTAVTGVGTQFTNTFKVGDTITVTTTSGSETKAITTITSDTALVTAAFTGTAAAGTAYTLVGGDRFAVKGNGNVGIGTITPTEALDINGNIHLAASGYIQFGVAGTNTLIKDDASSGRTAISARGNILDVLTANGGAWGTTRTATLAGGNGASGNLTIDSTTNATKGYTLINTGSGNVGIGTTTPSTFKLEVAGNVGPEADNTRDLGSSGRRWANVYATNFVGAITPSGFTAGSAIFAGASGVLSQDNANYFWDNTNKRLGIGNASPGYKLDVSGDVSVRGAPLRLWNVANNAQAAIQNDGTTGNAILGFYTTGTAAMSILQSGNVGIGTTSPTNALSFDGTTSHTIWMERNTTAATAGQGLTLSSGGAIAGTADLAGGDLTLKSGISTGTGSSAIHFFTATAGTTGVTDRTPTEKMTILGSGNVGIGTTNPADKLDVAGAILTSAPLGSHQTSRGVFELNGNKVAIRAYGATAGTGFLAFNVGGGGGSADSEAMRINSSGYVGIGTTSPQAVLQIGALNGSGYATNTGKILLGSGATNGPEAVNGIELESNFGAGGYGTKLYTNNSSDYFGIATRFNSPTWTERLVVREETGNVGIGTNGPLGNFQVNQPTTSSGTVATAGTTTLTGTGTRFTNTFKVGDTITVSGETVRTIASITSDTVLDTTVAFSTTASGLSYTLTGGPRFAVRGNGNVGIGTTTPTNLLTIVPSSAATYNVASSYGLYVNQGSAPVAIGADTNSGYIQSFGGKPLVINPAGNDVTLGGSTVHLGIGGVTPTAILHLKAGTATAGNAPLKFTSGTNLGTAETGAMEYDGTNLYFTPTGTTRKTIAYTSDLSGGYVPYTGATSNVDLGVHNLTVDTNSLFVDSTNHNVGIGTATPNASYKLAVNGNTTFSSGSTLDFGLGNMRIIDGGGSYYLAFQGWNGSAIGERMRITGAGNVGIGTAAPSTVLQVSSVNSEYVPSTATFSIQKLEEGYGLFAGISGTGRTWLQSGTKSGATKYDLVLNPNGGNIGIGNTTPGYPLDIKAASGYQINLGTASNLITDTTLIQTGGGRGYLGWDGTFQGTKIAVSDSGKPIVFADSATLGAGEIMRIQNRNVGIGTTSPAGLLQVTQATTSIGTVATAGTTTLTGTGTQFLNTFKVGDTITVSGETVRTIASITSNTVLDVTVAFSTTASGLSYTLTGGNRFAVLGNGNVGIGINTPSTALQINGTNNALPPTSGTTSVGLLRLNVNGATPALDFGVDTASTNASWIQAHRTSDYSTNYNLLLNPNGGNVGIGTTSPGAKLQVTYPTGNVGLAGLIRNEDAANGYGLAIESEGTAATRYAFTVRNLAQTNTYFHISTVAGAVGNVGIGTTSPTAVLHLKAGTATLNTAPLKFTAGTNLTTAETGAMEYDGTNLYFTPTGTTRKTIAYTSDLTGGYVPYTGATSNVDLGVHNLTVDTNTLFVDATNHRVGIGTTSPGAGYQLDVRGATAYVNIQSSTATNYALFKMNNGGGDLYFGRENSVGGGLGTGTSAYAGIINAQGTYPLQFLTNNNVAMTILNGGNVGIGTTTPGAYKLNVNGDTNITGNLIAANYQTKNFAYTYSPMAQNTNNYLFTLATYGNGDASYATIRFYESVSGQYREVQVVIRDAGGTNIVSVYPLNSSGGSAVGTEVRYMNRVADPKVTDFYITRTTAGSYTQFVEVYSARATKDLANAESSSLTAVGLDSNLHVTSTGNVGIGTTSPTNPQSWGRLLQISNSGTNGAGISLNDASANGEWNIASYGADLRFSNGINSPSVIIKQSGNVGIGTTSPTNALSFDGTAAHTIWMERNTTAATAGQGLTLSSGGAIAGTADLAGGDLTLKSGISTGTGSSAIHFFTATAGTTGVTDRTPTEKMTILGNGNVGINTTAPSYVYNGHTSLDINGDLRLRTGGYIETTSVENNAYYNSGYFRRAAGYAWYLGEGAAAGYVSVLTAPTGAIDSSISWSSPLNISMTNGNIGLGTTSPTAILNIKASSGAANTAPLKFTAGTNLGTAETGAMEYDGTNLYFTPTGTTRKTIAYTSDLSGGYIPYTGATSNVDLGIHNLTVDTNSLFVDSTNHRVGVGTTSPTTTLDVSGTGKFYLSNSGGTVIPLYIRNSGALATNNAAGIELNGRDASGTGANATQLLNIRDDASGNHRFVIRHDQVTGDAFAIRAITGNVGIGISLPGNKLEVADTNSVTAGEHYVANFHNVAGTAGVASGWYADGAAVTGGITRSINSLPYFIGTAGAPQALTILNGGNVGIGNTSPSEKLDVSGNIKMPTNSYIQGNTAGSSGNGGYLNFTGEAGTNAGYGIWTNYNSYWNGTNWIQPRGSLSTLMYSTNYHLGWTWRVATASGVDGSIITPTEVAKITTAGALTLNSTITAATTGTINGLNINSGALSGITTIGMSGQLTSTLATGTAPLAVTSTTLNTNLNADLLDGQHGSYYAVATGSGNYIQNQSASAQTASMWISGTIRAGRPANKVDNAGINEFSAFEINNAFAAGQSGYVRAYYPTYNNLLFGADYDGNVGGAQPNIQFGRVGNPTLTVVNNGTGVGNVGIGTTSPNQKLSVNGNIEIQGAVGTTRYILTDETNTGTGRLVMQAGGGSAAYGGAINLYANAHATRPGDVAIGLSAVAGAKFRVNDSGLDGGADLFTVLRTGNVGIGTTAPRVVTGSSGNKILDVWGDLWLGRTGVENPSINSDDSLYFNIDANNDNTTHNFVFTTNRSGLSGGAELMRIQENGNVGIGTTNPANFKLQVAGHVGPDADATYDLGSSANRFRNIYTSAGVVTGGYKSLDNDNLLYNGDFETGTSIGWSGVTSVTTGGYAGNYTAQFTGSTSLMSDDYIPVDPTRDVIQLEAYAKKTVAGTTPGLLYFGYYAYDASKTVITTAPCGTYCYFAAAGYVLPADGNWHKFSATTTGEGTAYPNFPVGTKYIKVLGLVNYSASGDAVTQIDHISVRKINNGPLFVGNNFSATNMQDQYQQSKIYTTSGNVLTFEPSSGGTLNFNTASTTPIQFTTSNNNHLALMPNGTGNVGVGVTSPAQKLSVAGHALIGQGTGATTDLIVGNSTAADDSGYMSFDWTNKQIQLFVSGDGRGTGLNVANGGNIGVGTTGPQLAFEVSRANQGLPVVPGGGAQTLGVARFGTAAQDILLDVGTENASPWGAWLQAHNTANSNAFPILLNPVGGNVGIGTTSPSSKLMISDLNKVPDGYISNSNLSVITSDAAGNNIGGSILLGGANGQSQSPFGFGLIKGAKEPSGTWGGYLSFWTTQNNSGMYERMRIDSNGNMGIGTTSPSTQTEIQRYETVNRTTYNDILTISALANTLPYNGHGGGILFRGSNYQNNSANVNYARIGSTINSNSTDTFGSNLFFDVTPTSAGTLTRAMTIKYNGNVGIGISDPQVLLQVHSPSSYADIRVSNGTNTQGIELEAESGSNNTHLWNYGNGFLRFGTNNLERVRIDNAGNVGIGITSPNYPIHINSSNEFSVGYQRSGTKLWGLGSDTNGTYFRNLTDLVIPMYLTNTGRVFIGATSEATSSSQLYVTGTTAANGSSSAIAGILGGYTFNPTAGGVQVGNRFVVTNSPTTTANTSVGEIIRTVDNTSLANLVRGLDITSNAGSNTAGTNTGLRSSGATFGIQGITSALAGGAAVPAAIYGESTGTTQGDVLRLYSNTVTSATSFATFYHDTSTFTGTGLLMDFATGSGTFSGNFIDLQNNNATVFKVSNAGVPSVGLSATAATSAVCSSLANATAPTANTAYELRDCSGAPVADYAEMYPVEEGILYGDIVATGTDIVETYDVGANGAIDWTKVKGNISKLVKSNTAYQQNVIGIVSENTNDFSSTGYNIKEEDHPMPVALSGRVPVKISQGSSPIKVGDYITTSMEEGKGMRALKSGFVIGKALEDWTPESGKLGIMVFVEQGFYESDSAHEFASQVTFGGLTFFNASAEFAKSVKFDDTVEFTVPPLFNSDTAGFAVIKAGSNRVDITFDKPYIATPVVNTTITFDKQKNADGSVTTFDTTSFFNDDIKSVVADKDENGFSIVINKNATTDLRFSWIALAVKNPKIFESVIPGLAIDSTTTPTIPTNNLAEVPTVDMTASATPITTTVDNSTTTSITTTEPTTTTTSTPVETTVTPDPVSDTGATATTAPSTEGATTTTDTTTP